MLIEVIFASVCVHNMNVVKAEAETDQQRGMTAEFSIYSALKHIGGKPYSSIHKMLVSQGLNIPINDLRRCLTKATRTALMKRTKRGYRMEIKVCDSHFKSYLQEFLDQEPRVSVCGPNCHKLNNDGNEIRLFRRGASILSSLGEGLVRNLSLLKFGRRSNMKRSVDEMQGGNENEDMPSSKKPCRGDQRGQQEMNHVLEDSWQEIMMFVSRLDQADLLNAGMPSQAISENTEDPLPN